MIFTENNFVAWRRSELKNDPPWVSVFLLMLLICQLWSGCMGWGPWAEWGGYSQGLRCGEVSCHHTLFLKQLLLPREGACIWAFLLPGADVPLVASSRPCWEAQLLSHPFLRCGAKPGGRPGQCHLSLGLPQLVTAPPST